MTHQQPTSTHDREQRLRDLQAELRMKDRLLNEAITTEQKAKSDRQRLEQQVATLTGIIHDLDQQVRQDKMWTGGK